MHDVEVKITEYPFKLPDTMYKLYLIVLFVAIKIIHHHWFIFIYLMTFLSLYLLKQFDSVAIR